MSTVQVGRTAAPPPPPTKPGRPRPGPDREAEVAQRPADPTPADADQAPRRRRYSVEIPVAPELLPFLALMAGAFALRVWDLGRMALHHDESLHAVYSWQLFTGRGYVHDPMMHGPLLFELNALAYFLLGASDATARVVPALMGVALVGLPWFLRHELGRYGALAASALFAISPGYLYYSRFLRQDIYVDVFTLLLMIGVFRYLATGRVRWFYTSVVAAALLFATKEDFFISGFIPFTFLVGCWFLLRGERRQAFRARVRALGWRPWAIGVAVFLALNVVAYTTFFTNPRGLCTALVSLPFEGCRGAKGALNYWLDQQDFARGGQPWFYYLFMLLPLYEFLPLVLGGLSLFLVRRKSFFYWFCVYWFVAAAGIYSWAGEKMPWMLPQIALPLVLLAGRLLGDWLEAGWARRALSGRGLAVAGLLLLAAFSLLSWIGLGAARVLTPVDQQTITLQRIALSVVVALVAGGLLTLGPRWGRAYLGPGIALGLLAVGGAIYLRTSLQVAFDHPDTPVEPLIYVQSSPDVKWITSDIERIASQTGRGKDLGILVDAGYTDTVNGSPVVHEAATWPFEWYLRDYKNKRYFARTIDPGLNLADYPVILVMRDNQEPIAEQLKQYTGQQYKLNWWFPEDYKSFATDGPTLPLPGKKVTLPGLRLDLLGQTLGDPRNQVKLLKFLLYREAPNELAGRELFYYVHNGVPGFGPANLAGSTTAPRAVQPAQPLPAADAPRETTLQTRDDGSTVFGRSASGAPALVDPKGVARGPDGRLYVVEGRAARVTVFNPDGSIARSWGGPGTGDGQFQEPWGIAVAPNGDVYVADTWNHRIQRFDASGTFLGKWGQLGDAKGRTDGQPGIFWGPRAIAIDGARGELYVTDTGNKRIQVFDLQGGFKRMFGGEGSGPGQLREAVGIALAADGTLWVADAWNRRIQHLDPDGRPLGEFPVPSGWESQAISNKPYLALDPGGRIAATFPDAGRATLFSQDGQSAGEIRLAQNGTPVGVAIGEDGRVYLADARNGVVAAYPLP